MQYLGKAVYSYVVNKNSALATYFARNYHQRMMPDVPTSLALLINGPSLGDFNVNIRSRGRQFHQ